MKLYKNRYPGSRKLTALFVLQIVLGVLPVTLFVLFVAYVTRLEELSQYSAPLGFVFVGVMLLSLVAYGLATHRYNVLVSGYRGERLLLKTAKTLRGEYTAFTNLPVRYKRNRSEIDLLLIGKGKVLIVEVKNHTGMIIGSPGAEEWTQRKYYRKGRMTEMKIDNPLNQLKRQREILKCILRAGGVDVWIDTILFFSGDPGLRIGSSGDVAIVTSPQELLKQIDDYPPRKYDSDVCAKAVEILCTLKGG